MKRRGIALTSLLAFNVVAFVVSATFSWFYSFNKIGTDTEKGIQGSLFTGYFHQGSGEVGDPFVITRPVHWENLVWLHNNVEGFYNANQEGEIDHGYFFQIGLVGLDEKSTVPQVYKYNDDGSPALDDEGNPEYSTTDLNLTCFSSKGKELIPIGSPQYPFIGALNGNNFNLYGFKIVSYDKYQHNEDIEDVGIFGFVGTAYGATVNDPAITNIYFSKFTIDTSSASLDDETTAYDYHPSHTPEGKESEDYYGKAYIGYVAGHINTSDSFDNVYVNECKIDGQSDDTTGQLNGYGYFGKVEYAKGSSSHGSGNNYSFSLQSSAVYSYMRNNYDSIKNNPISTRNAEYEINAKPPYFDGKTTIHPFSEAFSYVTSGFNTYNMIGDDPDDYSAGQYKGYNYSLSTMGYYPMIETGDQKEYGIKAKNGSSYVDIDPSTKIQTSLTTTDAGYVKSYEDAKKVFDQDGESKYLHYDNENKKWDYYKVHTHKKDDMKKVNLNITCNKTFTKYTGSSMTSNPTLKSAVCRVYIDGVSQYYNSNIMNKVTVSRTGSLGKRTFQTTISELSISLENLDLAVGNHTISATVAILIDRTTCRYSAYYYGSNASWSSSSKNDVYMNGSTFTISDTDPSTITKDIEITESSYEDAGTTENDAPVIYTRDSAYTPYVYASDSFDYDVYSTELTESGMEFDPTNCSIFSVFTDVKFKFISGKLDDGTEYHYLHAIVESSKSVPEGAEANWIADGINDYYDEDTAPYDPKNIDVVGGGIRFGYTHVTFDGENNSRTLAKTLTNDDIGETFYPTKYCPNSVILYLKNVGGTNPDDKMGEIEISYSWLAISGNLCEMLFKKGEGLGTGKGRYLALSNAAAKEDFDDDIQWNSRISKITLRRKYLVNASYCALDENNVILANYDASGNQIYPATTVEPTSIAKYVLCVGSKTTTFGTIDANVRLDYINFNYVAEHGFGGTFGSVEYRTQGETVQDTIVNFYYLMPVDDKYRIYVLYDSATKTYNITFNYYSTTSDDLLVNVYCYDLTYKVYVNGDQVATNGTGQATIHSAEFS